MIDSNVLGNIINEKLENSHLFLVELTSDRENRISVIIDGDHDVAIDDCISLSRHIEHMLKHETEDFSLQVSSPGVGQPLKMARQYPKNIGRKLKITLTNNSEITAKLVAIEALGITVLPVAQRKKTPAPETMLIEYGAIKKAFVLTSFK